MCAASLGTLTCSSQQGWRAPLCAGVRTPPRAGWWIWRWPELLRSWCWFLAVFQGLWLERQCTFSVFLDRFWNGSNRQSVGQAYLPLGCPSSAPRVPAPLPRSWSESAPRVSSGQLWICPPAQNLWRWLPVWTQWRHLTAQSVQRPQTEAKRDVADARLLQGFWMFLPLQRRSKFLVRLNEPVSDIAINYQHGF